MKSFFTVFVLTLAATGCVTASTQNPNNKNSTMSQDDLEFAPRNERGRAH